MAALIPYEVNAPLWSDGATKERWLALPDSTHIEIKPDGDLELPPGAVTVKTFHLKGRRTETRFFVRLMSGEWGGYTYEWNDAGTEATLLDEGSHRRAIDGAEWHYPSRGECSKCHTRAAGRTLGLEIGQLDGDVTYPGGQRADQLATWAHIGLFTSPLPTQRVSLPAFDDRRATLEARARAYLHANCSNCHRPGVPNAETIDFRFAATLAETMTCNVEPQRDTFEVGPAARIIAAGDPDRSMVAVRMLRLGPGRMPEFASLVVDREGVALVSDWIRSLGACP